MNVFTAGHFYEGQFAQVVALIALLAQDTNFVLKVAPQARAARPPSVGAGAGQAHCRCFGAAGGYSSTRSNVADTA